MGLKQDTVYFSVKEVISNSVEHIILEFIGEEYMLNTYNGTIKQVSIPFLEFKEIQTDQNKITLITTNQQNSKYSYLNLKKKLFLIILFFPTEYHVTLNFF